MYLTEAEIKDYYPKAEKMAAPEVTLYLARANSYVYGILGGKPNFSTLPTEEANALENGLKTAVALAFEYFTIGETAQVNPTNGNITEAAPAGYFQRTSNQSQLAQVDKMLKPYAELLDRQNTGQSDRGVSFL
jgi:hypothetical protein